MTLDPPLWFQLPMVILAAWRAAVLLVYEGGPFGTFKRLRSFMDINHDLEGQPVSWPDHLPGSLFGCVWCLSFWTSLVLYGILWVAPPIVVVLGIWGAATYLEALRTRR